MEKYYKDDKHEVFIFDEGTPDELIVDSLIEMSPEEILSFQTTGDLSHSQSVVDEFLLQEMKEQKKIEITAGKKEERSQGVVVKGIRYFSTGIDLQKYEHAIKTGKMIAEKQGVSWKDFKGTIKTFDGMVEIAGDEFNEALLELNLFLYRTWYKEQRLFETIAAASTEEELSQISWKDS